MKNRKFGAALVLVALLSAGLVVAGQEPPAQTGSFSFRDDRSQTIALTLDEADGVGGIAWPEPADRRWDTALLQVPVAVDAAATEAFVEIASGSLSDRQYFAPGDTGERWLNLSFLRGALTPGARISLRAQGVTFVAREAALRVFSTNPELSKSVLVLAPHPDDAEIAAFGVYARSKSTVVTVTAGNAGAPTYESVFDDPAELYLFKGRIRLIDSITIPWQGGVPPERAFNMGYFDARLAAMYEKRDEVVPEMYRPNSDINVYRKDNIGSLLPMRARESTWSHLVDDTLSVLKKVKPAVIVAPHPQLDTHRDHQYTTVALSEALARWKKDVTLLLYTNHADRNRYPYGPAGTLMSLPPPSAGNVGFDRIYSHPVPAGLQRQKLFALESMHDLRFNPSRQFQLARSEARTVVPEKPGPEPDITYLRRGPRSNELFFVYDQDTFAEMIGDFLRAKTTKP
jgi:LmbE family N-acetylglucosaminyl deacetylase